MSLYTMREEEGEEREKEEEESGERDGEGVCVYRVSWRRGRVFKVGVCAGISQK